MNPRVPTLTGERDEGPRACSLQWPRYISLRSSHDDRGNGNGAGGGSGGTKPLRVLVACEFSATVRREFAAHGHDAWSCDILPSEHAGNHLQCDVREVLADGWDMMIAHPPCTRLCNSGVRWLHERNLWSELREACDFFNALLAAPIRMIAVENPIPHMHARAKLLRGYDQIIQPWQFAHSETKATCLWLKNLPKLVPTDIRHFREARVHRMTPGPDRWRERSRTYPGIASAMARQWSAWAAGVRSIEPPTAEKEQNVCISDGSGGQP